MSRPDPESASIAAGGMSTLVFDSVVTCPHCGASTTESMPVDACIIFWDCPGCGASLSPKAGDCCVFCCYGSVPCPPVQQARGGCA